MNGDGFDDIAIVDENAVTTYVIFGHRLDFDDIDLASDEFFSSGNGFKVFRKSLYYIDINDH